MKEFFLKSKDSDKGIFLETQDDCVNISLWKKANSSTVKLNAEKVSELSEFLLNFIASSDSSSEEGKSQLDWGNDHILKMHNAKNPEEVKEDEERDQVS